jgi:demethylmenaquinone methyltransferase/2-methoxy-6-polyprenyl-1,4-benzoquinol methylase
MKDVRPYADREDGKKEQVETMFDNIAGTYDALNRVLSLGIDKGWRRKMIEVLKKEEAESILDVATGTADVALDIARELPNSKVIGLDLSSEMLSVGRQKVQKEGFENRVKLVKGDCEALPYDNSTFDAITVAFGVRNFETLHKGIEEMYRVLKPGGVLVVLEFTQPRRFPVKPLFNLYFKYVLPTIGRLTSKDPKAYQYLYDSVQVFPQYDAFLEQLNRAKFSSSYYKSLTFGICCIYVGYKS